MNVEVWKPVVGYEGLYEVSSYGRVRSLNYRNTNKITVLSSGIDKKGYKHINLSKDGKVKTYKLHRLVAQAFLPNPNNLPVINHIDENPSNNCVENLEWCTYSYNINYGTRIEKQRQKMIEKPPMSWLGKFGREHNTSKPLIQSVLGIFVKRWDNAMEVRRKLGFNNSHISACARGETKSAYGFNWFYAEDKAKSNL